MAKRLIDVAIRQRDEIVNALRRDRDDQNLQQRLRDLETGVAEGCWPIGCVEKLMDGWEPQTGFGEFAATYQQANAEAIQAGLGAVLLPKLEAVSEAHRQLLDDFRRMAGRSATGTTLTMPSSYEGHGQALNVVIGIVNALPMTPGTPNNAPAVEDHGGVKHPWGDDEPETLLSTAKLSDRLGIAENDRKKREAVRKRLESWRKANLDSGWIEPKDPKPREPKYLYPLGKVWPIIEDMKSG